MNNLQLLTVSPGIPEEGFLALATHLPKGSTALYALASRPDLSEPVADVLFRRTKGKARTATIRHFTDPLRLRELYEKVSFRSAVCANPHTPVDILEDVMTNGSLNEVALRAACNPSTPLEARRKRLEVRMTADALVAVNSPVALAVARSWALVENNQWMLEAEMWHEANIVRALVSRPVPAQKEFASLRARPFALSRVPGARNHPLLEGRTLSEMTLPELLAAENVAADLEALSRPEFDAATAATILGRAKNDPEPQIIAACLKKFGIAPFLLRSEPCLYADSRLTATVWLEPFAEYVKHLAAPAWDPIKMRRDFENQQQAAKHTAGFVSRLAADGGLAEALAVMACLASEWEDDFESLMAAAEGL
jgi:hypothetical protein